MSGQGASSIREVARRVGRDVKAVHGDIASLINAGVLDRTADSVIFPYDAVHVDFTLSRRPDTGRGHVKAIGSAATAERVAGGGQGGPGRALTTGSGNGKPARASTARHIINAMECRIFSPPTRESRRYRA
jgi:hypothetical protein